MENEFPINFKSISTKKEWLDEKSNLKKPKSVKQAFPISFQKFRYCEKKLFSPQKTNKISFLKKFGKNLKISFDNSRIFEDWNMRVYGLNKNYFVEKSVKWWRSLKRYFCWFFFRKFFLRSLSLENNENEKIFFG